MDLETDPLATSTNGSLYRAAALAHQDGGVRRLLNGQSPRTGGVFCPSGEVSPGRHPQDAEPPHSSRTRADMAFGSWLDRLDRRVLGIRAPDEPASAPARAVWESMPRDSREVVRLKFETGRPAADGDQALVLADLYDQALDIHRQSLRVVSVFWLVVVAPFAIASILLAQPIFVVTIAVGLVLIPGVLIALFRRMLRQRRDANLELAGLRERGDLP